MQDNIRDLIVAMTNDEAVAIQDIFTQVASMKAVERLDDLRVEVAQNMFSDQE